MDKAMATRPDAVSDASSYVRWPTIIAGAVAGAAVAFVLMAFAAAIGLAVASPSPTWRDASAWLALLSGVWVLLVQVLSFALAGYIAGRMRTKLAGLDANEVEFRDGMHGLLAWAVGVIRRRIREAFERRFTVRRMSEQYVSIYRRLVPNAHLEAGLRSGDCTQPPHLDTR